MKKIVMARIDKSFAEQAKIKNMSVNDYLLTLRHGGNSHLLTLEKEFEKYKQLPAIIDYLIEMRVSDRKYIDEIERQHRKDRESLSALTKAVANLTDVFTKALTKRISD